MTHLKWYTLVASTIGLTLMGAWMFVAITPEPQVPSDIRLTYRHCNAYGDSRYDIQCYNFRTNAAFDLRLPVAVLRYRSPTPYAERDLLVQIPGGPGQGFMTINDEIYRWLDWLNANEFTFDVLLYDPRGTGEGQPNLECSALAQVLHESLEIQQLVAREVESINAVIKQCLDGLSAQVDWRLPVDLRTIKRFAREFSLARQQDDVLALGAAAGYERLHLWGVSYGSRIALAAAGEAPVKSLIIDSVYPFERGLFSEWPALYEAALAAHEKLFERPSAHGVSSFMEIYQQLRERLVEAPIKVPVSVKRSGAEVNVDFWLTGDRLLELSFGIMYYPALYDDFYDGLDTLYRSNVIDKRLQGVLETYLLGVMAEDFNPLVYFMTECVDNQPETPEYISNTLRNHPEVADYFTQLADHDICAFVDDGYGPYAQARTYSDTPALIFAGELDPVTPAHWAVELADRLPATRAIVLSNAGHGSLFHQSCDWSFLPIFMANGDPTLTINCEAYGDTVPKTRAQ